MINGGTDMMQNIEFEAELMKRLEKHYGAHLKDQMASMQTGSQMGSL